MPATAIDPKTALVIIDLQKGILQVPTVHPIGEIVKNSVRLARAFRRAKLPVVLVNVGFSADGADAPRTRVDARRSMTMGPDFADLAPELDAQPSDVFVTKRQPNAFHGTELDLQLRRRGVTGIVITGVSTSSGVGTTARAAQDFSYNVTFAADAMTDVDPAAHELFVGKIFPRVGEVDTTDAILALLPGGAA